jgi:hypothetical protein
MKKEGGSAFVKKHCRDRVESRSRMVHCYEPKPLVTNSLFEFVNDPNVLWPSVKTAPMATMMIKASITAYSTAVAASSFRQMANRRLNIELPTAAARGSE